LAGPDRLAVRALYDALKKERLRVFLDETSIGLFDPITEEIENALRCSTALLAYYSRHYTSRPACQQELTAAFLAGQREGDPMRRIIVVNPEDPSTDHLLPAELADSIGKSALAAAYAWNFGAAYADGMVCWLSLDGAGASDAALLARYDDEVRTIAELLGLGPGDSRPREVSGRVADHLAALDGPSLWVVDDVPPGLDPGTVSRLVLPGDTRVRTILSCHEDRYGAVARSVVLGPMPDPDVALLLEQFRVPTDAERDGFDRLVPQLRGHPLVVHLAGNALKLLGDPGWLPLMREVRDRARDAVGRENDLYAQSLIALGLLRLPTPLVRAVTRFGRPDP
jgi:TIR domain